LNFGFPFESARPLGHGRLERDSPGSHLPFRQRGRTYFLPVRTELVAVGIDFDLLLGERGDLLLTRFQVCVAQGIAKGNLRRLDGLAKLLWKWAEVESLRSRLTGMSRPAIYRSIAELHSRRRWKPAPGQRICRPGGARTSLSAADPMIR
jgi:hypothetical protein